MRRSGCAQLACSNLGMTLSGHCLVLGFGVGQVLRRDDHDFSLTCSPMVMVYYTACLWYWSPFTSGCTIEVGLKGLHESVVFAWRPSCTIRFEHPWCLKWWLCHCSDIRVRMGIVVVVGAWLSCFLLQGLLKNGVFLRWWLSLFFTIEFPWNSCRQRTVSQIFPFHSFCFEFSRHVPSVWSLPWHQPHKQYLQPIERLGFPRSTECSVFQEIEQCSFRRVKPLNLTFSSSILRMRLGLVFKLSHYSCRSELCESLGWHYCLLSPFFGSEVSVVCVGGSRGCDGVV